MNYNRVLPRDLFNEAKLLKNLGRLILDVEDHMDPVSCLLISRITTKNFIIRQDQSDGSIYELTTYFRHQTTGAKFHFSTGLNCRYRWGLIATDSSGDTAFVFKDPDGLIPKYSKEFTTLLSELSKD